LPSARLRRPTSCSPYFFCRVFRRGGECESSHASHSRRHSHRASTCQDRFLCPRAVETAWEAFDNAGWVKTDKWKPAFVWHLMWRRTNDTGLYQWPGSTCSGEYKTAHMLYPIQMRLSRVVIIFESGKPITRSMEHISGRGAATHDVAIEIAKRGRLIDHLIDPHVDAERDFIGASLTKTLAVSSQEYLYCVAPVFQAQTASGEAYYSNSSPGSPEDRSEQQPNGRPIIRPGDLSTWHSPGGVFPEQPDLTPLISLIAGWTSFIHATECFAQPEHF